MIYKAYPLFTQSLLMLPESGMGYQIIDARRQGGFQSKRFIVYNSELIVDYDSDFLSFKNQIMKESFNDILNRSAFIYLESPTLVKRSSLRNIRMLSESNMNNKGRQYGGSGAIDNTPIYANGSQIFVRLSAYSNDKRIDNIRKRLLDGSYTTTEQDYLACKKYSDDPVDRYALPSDEKIRWAFFVKPKSFDKYRPGIVQPANNHNGGGFEALFDNGTSDGTYLEMKPY